MKTTLRIWLSAFGVLAMALPVHAADEPARKLEQPTVTDVILTTGGSLTGMVVTADGKPSVNTPVQIFYKQNVVAAIRTDKTGRYTVQGIRSGVHKVRSANGEKVFRCWYSRTAPPSARKQLILTAGEDVVRGNNGGLSRNQIIGATAFALTSAAVWISVSDNNPVNQGPPPPSSP